MDEGTLTKTKEMLDDMHKRKIDMADEIFVINKNGYIGDSARSEIEYARDHGKRVRYYEDRISTLKMLVVLREDLQDSKGGEWIVDHKNDGSPEHPIQMPFVNFTVEMKEFIKRVYDVDSIFPEFELKSYQKVLEKNGLEWNGDSIKKADLSKLDEQGIMAVMLGAIRADRFCEGALLGFFKDGYIDKWLGRLEELVSGSDNQGQYMEENSKKRIVIVNKNITRLRVDAIVNAANEELRAGGGVCGAIFIEAGHTELQEACNKIGHCDTGKAVITPGFKLPAKYIIHAVGPVWHGDRLCQKKNKKGRLLAIQEYFYRYTDEAHPASTAELIAAMEKMGYKANRKTIKDDIDILIAFDVDIVTNVSRGNSFFMEIWQLEVPELKLLVDAVSSSRFISARRSENLIDKILSLGSIYRKSRLSPEFML